MGSEMRRGLYPILLGLSAGAADALWGGGGCRRKTGTVIHRHCTPLLTILIVIDDVQGKTGTSESAEQLLTQLAAFAQHCKRQAIPVVKLLLFNPILHHGLETVV
jgi:hypothetical protein